MSPPCTIQERDGVLVAESPKGETLRVELLEVLDDRTYDLGDDPGLEKDGVEAELQELIAARVEALREGFTLIRREYPTDIGPIDLLCRDGDGRAVAVEIKRVGEIAGRRAADPLPGAPGPRHPARPDRRHVRRDAHQAAGPRVRGEPGHRLRRGRRSTTCARTTRRA